ncbi:MAG: tRNA pseudouridine(38-40) synthase TruA [Marmoricola sp.]
MRLRLDLAYDGTAFHGWATQPGLRTVQETLELALATVLRVAEVGVTCAGRTDAGVHARGQVVHLDVAALPTSRREPDEEPPGDVLTRRLNGVLPLDVRVRRTVPVPDAFDARFSALWRRYAYRIADKPEAVDPLTRGHVLAWPRPLDVAAMNAASEVMLGQHDFAAFCRRREGATTIRVLRELSWARGGDSVLVGTVSADAFCHHMVRALVGCLIAVGEGRRGTDWPAQVLGAGVRDPTVTVVHAHGLTLEEVGYPADEQLEARARETRAVRTAEGRP